MPGCFELDYMFRLLIGRASSSTASIHKNDLTGLFMRKNQLVALCPSLAVKSSTFA